MAREASRLTDIQVKAFAKDRPDKTRYHHDGRGLYFVVDKRNRSTSWAYRYMIEGKARVLGLGRYPDIGLKDARKRADEARRVKAHGQDPLVVKNADKIARTAERARAVTFKDLAEEFIRSRALRRRPQRVRSAARDAPCRDATPERPARADPRSPG